MNPHLPPSLERLITELGKWPGIGRKTAMRLGMHLLSKGPQEMRELAHVLEVVAEKSRFCEQCGNVSEEELCVICQSPGRDAGLICVVEQLGDLLAIERSAEFRGLYHVLGGVLSPLDRVGPEDLRIHSLLKRVEAGGIREVILALNPTVEGDATMLYLQRQFEVAAELKITRLARGIPMGGSLDFLDQLTLGRALGARESLRS